MKKLNFGEKGAVLILTFLIMTTLIVITGGFLYMTSTQLRGSGYDLASAKALWIAEAGLQDVFYKLKNDSAYRDNPTPVSGTLGNGSYSVSVTKSGSTYTITSTGTVNVLNRKIIQTAVVTSGLLEAFYNAIYADGNNINFKNSTGTVNGNIRTRNQVINEENMTINGTITENSPVTIAVDFNYYLGIADSVVSGNKTFSAGQIYTGIWYVDGAATIQDNVTINGTIVATGNITLQGSENVTTNPVTGYPSLIAGNNVNGRDLEDSTINGLIYAGNNIDFRDNEYNAFTGTFIAMNNILITGAHNFTITYNSIIQTNPPPGFSGSSSSVAVTAQKDWNEVVP